MTGCQDYCDKEEMAATGPAAGYDDCRSA